MLEHQPKQPNEAALPRQLPLAVALGGFALAFVFGGCATTPAPVVAHATKPKPSPKPVGRMDVKILLAPRASSTGADGLFVYANVAAAAEKVEFCFQGTQACSKKEAVWMEAPRIADAQAKIQTYGMVFKKSVLGNENGKRRLLSVRTTAPLHRIQVDRFSVEYMGGQWSSLALK